MSRICMTLRHMNWPIFSCFKKLGIKCRSFSKNMLSLTILVNGRRIFKVRKCKIAFTIHPKSNFIHFTKTFLAFCYKSLQSSSQDFSKFECQGGLNASCFSHFSFPLKPFEANFLSFFSMLSNMAYEHTWVPLGWA